MSNLRPSFFILFVIIVILILFILLRCSCCKSNKDGFLLQDTIYYTKNHGLNILFKANISLEKKEKEIEEIKDSVRGFYKKYNNAYGTTFTPNFFSVAWCPCDSTLYTLNFTCVNGEGKSATSPPTKPPPPTLGGSGNLIDVVTVSQNMAISEINNSSTIDTNQNSVIISGHNIDNSKILAIMDTGIDSTLFPSYLSNLIWRDPSGKPTLYNFIPGQPTNDMLDNGRTKHGSAVTAIAIKAMDSSISYPRLMILKVLDSNERGTTFSVSCALSYAVQHQATLVNGSLGYIGAPDSVLYHYIELCNKNNPDPIQLFFAAGNTNGAHNSSFLCSSDYNNNLLKNDSLFYPACFSGNDLPNITSVTQIRQPGSPCYYQFFSKDYITLGVLNYDTTYCCSFKVDFIHSSNLYEGSSFATPYASGLKMTSIINRPAATTGSSLWATSLKTSSTPYVTKDGKYIFH